MRKQIQQIRNIRRAVATMANTLRKTGLSLSEAFKKAWRRVKLSMTIRAAGTTCGNRQEILRWLSQFKQEELTVSLSREVDNKADQNAIRIVAHVLPMKKRAVIGYIPAGLARELAKVLDVGIEVTASLKGIIGGYSYKENYGALVNIAI